jgi:hypothetical protein
MANVDERAYLTSEGKLAYLEYETAESPDQETEVD